MGLAFVRGGYFKGVFRRRSLQMDSGLGTRLPAEGFGTRSRKLMKRAVITIGVLSMLLAMVVLFVPQFGWRVDKVLSGSMSPALQTGGGVVSRPVDPSEIVPGDIITFRSPRNGELTTHRVIGVEESVGYSFKTKGDANASADPYMVPEANLEGRVVLHVPLLGHAAGFAKTPVGFGLMLGLPGMTIIVLEIRRMWRNMSEDEERKKAEKQAGAVNCKGVEKED